MPVVCDGLLCKNMSSEWLFRAIAMKSCLSDYCRSNEWSFVNHWDSFYSRNTMLSRNGDTIHTAAHEIDARRKFCRTEDVMT